MTDGFSPDDERFMRLALAEAERALEHDDVPVGAVLVRAGEAVGAGRNERELLQDPSAHAEMLALRQGAQALGSWRLLDCTLYVTLEPCAMCAGAIVLARVPRVVFGTADPKAGAAGATMSTPATRPASRGAEERKRRGDFKGRAPTQHSRREEVAPQPPCLATTMA